MLIMCCFCCLELLYCGYVNSVAVYISLYITCCFGFSEGRLGACYNWFL